MDIFSQKKFLVRLVVFLSLLNITVISVFAWKEIDAYSRPHKPREKGAALANILQKELNLTEAQTKLFNNIRMDFFSKEKALSEIIRSQRDSMNGIMFSKNANDGQLKALAAGIAQNENRMELLRIEQASSLRAVCTPEQLLKFEKLINEIRDYLKPERPVQNAPH